MEKLHLQKTALGMVETIGLVASIEAADAMAKVANVVITSPRVSTMPRAVFCKCIFSITSLLVGWVLINL